MLPKSPQSILGTKVLSFGTSKLRGSCSILSRYSNHENDGHENQDENRNAQALAVKVECTDHRQIHLQIDPRRNKLIENIIMYTLSTLVPQPNLTELQVSVAEFCRIVTEVSVECKFVNYRSTWCHKSQGRGLQSISHLSFSIVSQP